MTTTTTKRRPLTWAAVFNLYRGSRIELATALGLTRMGLWHLINGTHAKAPVDLIHKLAVALRRTRDGDKGPNAEALLQLWAKAHGGAS